MGLNQIIKIGVVLTITVFTMMQCTQDCTEVCEFEGDLRIDTLTLFGWDTLWIASDTHTVVTFDGDNGTQLEYEVLERSKTYASRLFLTDCGTCGDSIMVREYIPTFVYRIQEVTNGDEWKLTFGGDYFVVDTNRLYKCVDADIRYSSISNQETFGFLPGCNIALDTTLNQRFNRRFDPAFQYFGAPDTMICPIDSASLATDTLFGEIEYLELSLQKPIRSFRRDGICYSFSGVR